MLARIMDEPQTIEEKLEVLSRLSSTIKADKRLSVPRNDRFTRADVVNAFSTAFEMIGGVTRLALWANENPGEFFKLYSKLLPSTNLNIVQRLPDEMAHLSTAELEQIVLELKERESLPGEYQVEREYDSEFTH